MKKLAYITMIAALIFGAQSTWAAAPTSNDNVVGPTVALPSGSASYQYDQESQQLMIEMATAGDTERVTVQLASSRGQIITNEMVIVDGRGGHLNIDMRGLDPGVFNLKISSNTIHFSKKVNTKVY